MWLAVTIGQLHRFHCVWFHLAFLMMMLNLEVSYQHGNFFLISWTTLSLWRQAYSDPQGFTYVGTGSSRLVTVSRLVSARDSHPHSSTCHIRPHLQITDESQQEQPVNSGARQHRLVSIHIFPLLWLVGRNAYGNASDFCSWGAWFESLLQMIFCGLCLPFWASDMILPEVKPGLLWFISFYILLTVT